MIRLDEKMKKYEKTLGVKTGPTEYFVLLRRKKKWLCDEMGLDQGSVVMGEPSERDLALIFPSHIAGPFTTREEANEYLAEELEKLKAEHPERFRNIASLQKPITSPIEVK